jgi:hypothetical protein
MTFAIAAVTMAVPIAIMAIVPIIAMLIAVAVATVMMIALFVPLALATAGMGRFFGKCRATGQQADEYEGEDMAAV